MAFFKPKGVNGLTVEEATENVHLAIRRLLSDEYPDLARRRLQRKDGHYFQSSFTIVKNYLINSLRTWWNVVKSFGKIFIGGTSPVDFLSAVMYSLAITVILTGGLVVCIVCTIPFLDKLYDWYAKRHGGVTFINIVNSDMFVAFTEEELRLAKEAMSSTEHPPSNTMNLDLTKMMLLFAALMYERSSEKKQEAIRRCSTMDWSHLKNNESKTLPPNHHHDLFTHHSESAPLVERPHPSSSSPMAMYSPGPSSFPHRQTVYGTFPPEFASWQQDYIARSPYSSYARPRNAPRTNDPSFGTAGSSDAAAAQDSGVIYDAMKRWDFEYEPISELDSDSSAYCAAFWDKTSNWVVIAFKGTSPPEFDEWLVDFDYTRVPVGEYIPNYGSVHHGIKTRLFPDEPTYNRTPYETIVAALKIISDDLLSRTTTDVVNVYFTGHSLGSGIASLAYARAMQNIDGLDPRVKVGDAYLFSSPIVSDMATAELFNKQLVSGPSAPRTVWRVVNHHDAVATLFPALGDDPKYAHPESLFAFAHLGTEVRMRRKGTKSLVENNYDQSSTTARAISGLPAEKVGNVPRAVQVPKWMIWVQYVPLAGWMFSHFPGLYFESIEAMQAGEMVWQKKQPLD